MTRVLPHSLEAEENLLSCCMMDGVDVVTRCVLAKISPASFYDPKHTIIYSAMLDMVGAKKPIEVSTLAEELKTTRHLNTIGGYAFLAQVSSRIPTTAQASYFIEKVRELALLRELIRTNTSIVEDCYNYSGKMDEFLGSVEKKFLSGISSHSSHGDSKPLDAICAEIVGEVQAMREGKSRGDENDLSWGINDLDRFLKKFRRGELVVLAARPGIGKSSLMRQICIRNVIRDGKNAAVFTLEVTTDEYVRNTAQALAGVNPREIANYPTDEQESLIKWIQRIGTFKDTLHIYDVNASLSNILAQVRMLHSRKPVDVVFIDYLQLINEKTGPGENRDQLLGRITRALKLLANELKCVVVLLSQLNRASERDERPPQLSDLRESGNIEADSDRVCFIYRPPTVPGGAAQNFTDDTVRFLYCEIIQRKGRNVGEHSIGINFDRPCARFIPISKHEGKSQTRSHQEPLPIADIH